MSDLTLLTGNCLDVLPTLADRSVQCVVTSPPYFGLRDYGVDGQLGLEKLHDCLSWARDGWFCEAGCYVCALRRVFEQIKRVLRDDGVVFLNLGDSYAMSTRGAGGLGKQHTNAGSILSDRRSSIGHGLKPKDLIGIPWRVALALQADGWWLRADNIWDKGNPMPESVKSRTTRSHEYVFMLAKSERYYYDAAAIAEASVSNHPSGNGYKRPQQVSRDGRGSDEQWTPQPTRNARSVWRINTVGFSGAHFATFPPKLVERCILAGTSPQACEVCGAPWARVVERAPNPYPGSSHDHSRDAEQGNTQTHASGTPAGTIMAQRWYTKGADVTTGWAPTCRCEGNTGTARCTVLDCFAGSGTTGRVAIEHNRNAVLIDLNAEYGELQKQRTDGVQRVLL